jgi:hypothetical protein
MPEPLLTIGLYPEFLQIPCNFQEFFLLMILVMIASPEVIDYAKLCLVKLPQFNRFAFQYLCKFLTKVAEQSKYNKMEVKNLSIVFGPNILKPE